MTWTPENRRAWADAHPIENREAQKRWQQSPKGKASAKRSARRSYLRTKRNAHFRVGFKT